MWPCGLRVGFLTLRFQNKIHLSTISIEVSIFIKPTSTIEILNLISTLNNNKSSGPFSIPTDIFKMTGNIMASPLTEIINLSFSTGIYPNNLKITKKYLCSKIKDQISNAIIIDQFHCYLILTKYLKN